MRQKFIKTFEEFINEDVKWVEKRSSTILKAAKDISKDKEPGDWFKNAVGRYGTLNDKATGYSVLMSNYEKFNGSKIQKGLGKDGEVRDIDFKAFTSLDNKYIDSLKKAYEFAIKWYETFSTVLKNAEQGNPDKLEKILPKMIQIYTKAYDSIEKSYAFYTSNKDKFSEELAYFVNPNGGIDKKPELFF
jgi:hypothetical protein